MLLDPLDPKLKGLASPTYMAAIRRAPEIADVFGLNILAVGVAVTAVGWVLGRAMGGKPQTV